MHPTCEISDAVYDQPGSHPARGLIAKGSTGPARRLGIVVLHEAFGLGAHVTDRIAQLATSGYIALAADLFGARQLPDSREQASSLAAALMADPELLLGRIQASVNVLRDCPLVDAHRIAIIGYCFGGSAALAYGRSTREVSGVACFHGRLTTDKPLTDAAGAARFAVFTGAADPLVPREQILAFSDEMTRARADWQMNVYATAGHAFTDTRSAALGIPGVAYNESADARSWRALQLYLAELSGQQAPVP